MVSCNLSANSVGGDGCIVYHLSRILSRAYLDKVRIESCLSHRLIFTSFFLSYWSFNHNLRSGRICYR